MAPHPEIARLGFRGHDIALADSFLRYAQGGDGATEAESLRLLRDYVRAFGATSKADALDVAMWLEATGVASPALFKSAFEWHETVERAGVNPDVIPQLSAPDRSADD